MKFSFEVYDIESSDFRNFKVIEDFPKYPLKYELQYIDEINCYIQYINQYDTNGYNPSSDYIIYADSKTIKYVGECAYLVEEYVNKNIHALREQKLKRILDV